MLTKTIRTEFKVHDERREIEGYASVFGNVDLHGDRVHKGAFRKTLRERLKKGKIKVRQRHVIPIGKPVHAEEDSTGLLTVSKISRTQAGDETLILAEDGVMDRMSIGYREVKWDDEDVDGRVVHNLRELTLYEWSMTDLAANEEAVVTGVKSLDDLSLMLKEEDLARRFFRQAGISTREDLAAFVKRLEVSATLALALPSPVLPEEPPTPAEPPAPEAQGEKATAEPTGTDPVTPPVAEAGDGTPPLGDAEPPPEPKLQEVEPELVAKLHSAFETARLRLAMSRARHGAARRH